ncbi:MULTISPECIES: 5-oxoprolinase subunit PxpB [Saccharibacillus]|uniref:5-oxoprolinase subunit PxpB n=1 Tax=Saccharibacillus TaxID=456492 RepID=UPI00301D0B65
MGGRPDLEDGQDRSLKIEPLGETALRVVLGTEISSGVQRDVRRLMRRLEQRPLPGMIEAVPSFAAVTIFYDPLRTAERLGVPEHIHGKTGQADAQRADWLSVSGLAAAWLNRLSEVDIDEDALGIRTVDIPVLYGGEHGPDLAFVADRNGLTEQQVVDIHAGAEYPVYMIGFAPGFPYLGRMDERIAAPRLSTPRMSVPAGAVGIAGAQTGVYPVSTPGGWRIIGRTPVALFRADRMPPSLLQAGDRVKFWPITAEKYAELADAGLRHADTGPAADSGEEHGQEAESESGAGLGGVGADAGAEIGVGVGSPGKIGFENEACEDCAVREPVLDPAEPAADSESTADSEAASARADAGGKSVYGGLSGAEQPSIAVLKPGLLTTLQDLGRPGYQQYGVTAGGAMDAYALRAANLLAGNAESEAALEITLTGPVLCFERESRIALTGADLAPTIGGEPLPMWRPVTVRAGAVLEFGTAVQGCRAYLALAGGFGAPEALSSRSTDLRAGLGGLEGRALRAGDVLHARTPTAAARPASGGIRPEANFAAAAWHAAHGYIAGLADWAGFPAAAVPAATPAPAEAAAAFAPAQAAAFAPVQSAASDEPGRFGAAPSKPARTAAVAVTAVAAAARSVSASKSVRSSGPAAAAVSDPSRSAAGQSEVASTAAVRFTRGTHYALFDEASRAALVGAAFGVTPQSDRMGCRLSGPTLGLEQPLELISEAVAPGTVQVPPDGRPIVLTADRQTTGGYPRIAQIAAVDLRVVAQLRPGQSVRFVEISLEEAERLYMEREREMERLRIAVRLRSR